MALEVDLIAEPYEVCFTGNPIAYVLALSPYGTLEQGENIQLLVNIMLALTPGAFTSVKSQTFFPDADGMIDFDIATIIDPYLSFFVPKPILGLPVAATNQTMQFQITYQLLVDGANVGTPGTSDIATAIKGGMAYEDWHQSEFFTNIVLANKKPLNFDAIGELVGKDETRYIYWIYPYDDGLNQTITIVINTTASGTSYTYTFSKTIACGKWGICCIAVGYNRLALDSLVTDPTLFAISYTVTITNSASVVIATKTYTLDYRQFYRTEQLLYRNSVGALDTIRLRGQIDFEADYVKQSATRIIPPAYYTNGVPLAQSTNYYNEETEKKTGDTGFLSKAAQQKLRDLFLAVEIYELYKDRLLPVNVIATNTKFYSNKDSLISLQIQWAKAYVNNYFTPKDLMPTARTCPSMLNLIVRQINGTTLRIMWAIPSPYDQVKVTITVPQTSGSPIEYDFYYQGTSGVVLQCFINTATSGTTVDVTITGQVVCSAYSSPMDLGASTTLTLTAHGIVAPVAANTYYNIIAGYVSATTLAGSVLANDYDPEDGTLSVTAASGATSAGGTYSITNAGIVTYTPPSSVFIGADTFTYTLNTSANSLTTTGTCQINVGSSVIPVWAKVVTTGTGSSTQILIKFFSNSAGTIAVDVTGFGLNVNYDEDSLNLFGYPRLLAHHTNIIPTGSQIVIFSGYPGTGMSSHIFKLVAGTGYTIIT